MTTETFVTMIWKRLKEKKEIDQETFSLPDYGRRRGWLEDKDAVDWKKGIERRTAARIIHEILRKERNEADEESWRGAERLKDLYDCHTCVNHVAQVYAKGIMEPVDGNELFGMHMELTTEEALAIIPRIFSKEKRKITQTNVSPCQGAVRLSLQEALTYCSEEKQAVLIDVRTFREYEEEHMPGAIWIPMSDIIRNPHDIAKGLEIPLLFYCRQGYQSEIAANCVAEAGYKKVYYFANA